MLSTAHVSGSGLGGPATLFSDRHTWRSAAIGAATGSYPQPKAMTFACDAEIAAQDDSAMFCYLIIGGCARTVRIMADGRRLIGEFLFAGDVFGWEALDTHDFGAEAVAPTLVHRFPRDGFEAILRQDTAAGRRVRSVAASQMRFGRNRMLVLGRKTAAEKVASFLLEMAGRLKFDGQAHILLPMTRADIADYLGLNKETVCRQMTCLRERGAIEVDHKKVVIRDRGLLEKTSGTQWINEAKIPRFRVA